MPLAELMEIQISDAYIRQEYSMSHDQYLQMYRQLRDNFHWHFLYIPQKYLLSYL